MRKFKQIFSNRKGESELVSDKWSSYIDIYDKIFEKYITKEISIAEIGVQNGGSLEVYNEYFPNVKVIIGVDNNEKCRELNFSTNKINLIISDAANKSIVSELRDHSDQYDIIVDDGSHTSEDIIKSFSNLFTLIKNGGIYVIEDMHTSYFHSCNNGLYAPHSANTFFKLISDIINYQFWNNNLKPSDILYSFKKKYNLELSDNDLMSIKSITFYNSLCVIEKDKSALIGKRIFSGKKENVVETIKSGMNVEDIFIIDKTLIEDPNPPELAKIQLKEKINSINRSMVELEKNLGIKQNENNYLLNAIREKNIISIVLIRLIKFLHNISHKIFKKKNPMNYFLRLLVRFNIISQKTINIFIKYE